MAETDTTYIPPAMLADIDDSVIHARMMGNLPPDIDTTEGGFPHDFTRPAAIEKADMLIALNETVQIFFAEWAYGAYLDQHAIKAGLSRKPGNRATGYVTVNGTPGFVIAEGFIFVTRATVNLPSIRFAAVRDTAIGSEGDADVYVECADGGAFGNVPANSIILMETPAEETTAVTNAAPMTGGSDEESDASLRARIKERNHSMDASFVGSQADYVRWAKEVPGVGGAICIPEWKGKGTGTVKLVVADASGKPANEAICEAVYAYIISPENEYQRKAPIGATLTVEPTEEIEVSVSADVVLVSGYLLEDVRTAFERALIDYMGEAASSGSLVVTQLSGLLSGIPGVFDYSEFIVNGGTVNIPIMPGYFPSIVEVALND